MLSGIPAPYRGGVQATLAAGWLASALAGIGGVWLTPQSIIPRDPNGAPPFIEPTWVIVGASIIMLAASLVASYGVIVNQFRLEWVGAWFAAGGAFTYVGLVWVATLTTPTRLQQAGIVTALLLWMVSRALWCAGHAKKLRLAHTITTYVDEAGG